MKRLEEQIVKRLDGRSKDVRAELAKKEKYRARTDDSGLVIILIRGEWFTYVPEGVLGVSTGDTISVRDYVIKSCHDDAGHPGPAGTVVELLRNGIYWFTMETDVSKFITSVCYTCMTNLLKQLPMAEQRSESDTYPLKIILIDHVDLGEIYDPVTDFTYKMVLSAIDQHTGYAWFFPVPDKTV